MNALRFILSSLWHYRRIHLAVALGVAVATAVLTGALLIGDSMRGSLRDLTLQRLGQIDSAIVAPHMFRAELATEIAGRAEFRQHFAAAVPGMLVNGTLQVGGKNGRRAQQISVIGSEPRFWSLGDGGPAAPLANGDAAITQSLAEELDVNVGDEILLRVPVAGAIPADSPLGAKQADKTSRSARWRVSAVLPPEGLARFGLAPNQQLPRNVFVSLASLQKMLGQPGKANAIFLSAGEANAAAGDEAQVALRAALRPALEDFGLRVEQVTSPTNYVEISADQLVLPDAVVRAAERAFSSAQLQPVVTYLANTISIGAGGSERKIPYSIVVGVDSASNLGPVLDDAGQPVKLANNEIVLNRWAADDLKAKVGDDITLTFYDPESTHGELREHVPVAVFKLRAIVELKSKDGRATAATDPRLTPEMPGVTDQKSISDWDLPFELVEKIRAQDEAYWDEHRTTPKAFVSLAAAKLLWASRWGTVSLLRLAVDESVPKSETRVGDRRLRVAERLRQELDPAALGILILPVKKSGLEASAGSTPFGVLFLCFSFFLIASAVMLVMLLFQLGIEQRVTELGTLASVGIGKKRIAGLLGIEGFVVAAIGTAVGVPLGVLYAGLLITGVGEWAIPVLLAVGEFAKKFGFLGRFVAACLLKLATDGPGILYGGLHSLAPFLKFHKSSTSLALGSIAGVVVSWLAIRWSIRKFVRLPAARLLSGNVQNEYRTAERGADKRGWRRFVSWTVVFRPATIILDYLIPKRRRFLSWSFSRIILAATVVMLSISGFFLHGEEQAGIFFGSGAAMLVLLLGEIRHRLRLARGRVPATFSLARLSASNMARNPGRSTLTIGLVAAASFLIVAVSAFRLETGEAGTGGFELLATSDQPIHFDLNTAAGRLELGISDAASRELENWRIFSLRIAAGEDASCLNLYQPKQPRVLGIPKVLVERGGFAWAGMAKGFAEKPWTALDADLGRDAQGTLVVPAVLDMSTAVYSLHLKGVGSRLAIRDGAGANVIVQVVGLLENSVLQGNVLVSEANFLKMFPSTGGYRFFMMERVGPPSRGGPDKSTSAAKGPPGSRDVPSDGTQSLPATLETALAEEGFDVTDAREQLATFLAVQNTYLSTFQSLGALGLLLGTIGLAVVQLRSVVERRGELALMRAGGFRRGRLTWMIVSENIVLLGGGLAVGCSAAGVALIPQWAPHGASIPWMALALLLGAIVIVGLGAGWLATRPVLRAPVVPALRGD